MARAYEVIELCDFIDEVFGPADFQVDRILYHAKPALPESAEVRDWTDRVERTMIGRNMSWVPYADEWPNDDEPDECG